MGVEQGSTWVGRGVGGRLLLLVHLPSTTHRHCCCIACWCQQHCPCRKGSPAGPQQHCRHRTGSLLRQHSHCLRPPTLCLYKQAAQPMVEELLRELKKQPGLEGPLSARILDDGDAVGGAGQGTGQAWGTWERRPPHACFVTQRHAVVAATPPHLASARVLLVRSGGGVGGFQTGGGALPHRGDAGGGAQDCRRSQVSGGSGERRVCRLPVRRGTAGEGRRQARQHGEADSMPAR